MCTPRTRGVYATIYRSVFIYGCVQYVRARYNIIYRAARAFTRVVRRLRRIPVQLRIDHAEISIGLPAAVQDYTTRLTKRLRGRGTCLGTTATDRYGVDPAATLLPNSRVHRLVYIL